MGPNCDERRLERLAEYQHERTRLRALVQGSILWGVINLILVGIGEDEL